MDSTVTKKVDRGVKANHLKESTLSDIHFNDTLSSKEDRSPAQHSPESLFFSKAADSSIEKLKFESPNFATISKPSDFSQSANNDTFESASRAFPVNSDQETLVSDFLPDTVQQKPQGIQESYDYLPKIKNQVPEQDAG
jgi:hypothetical protein